MTVPAPDSIAADFAHLRERAAAAPPPTLAADRSHWIFGAGHFGRQLASAMQAQGIAVAGFVETAPRMATAQGLPVLDWDALARQEPDAPLVLGIFNRDTPYDQLLRIPAAAGFAPPLMPWALYEQFSEALGWRFWLSPRTFLLEPDPHNYAQLVRQACAHTGPRAICLPLAAAATHASLTFNAGQGEACSVLQGGSVAGGTSITAVALDQLLPGTPVHLLKLDIEGAEAQALRGASQLIARWRPVLAVSLYHKPQDLWELPELLFELCPGYRFHIRQHGFNTFESVLYAVPHHESQ